MWGVCVCVCVCVCIKWNITYESENHSVMSNSLPPLGLYSRWNSPGQNTGVGSLFLQGIFPTQGLNPGIPHSRWILYHLSHKGSPYICVWVCVCGCVCVRGLVAKAGLTLVTGLQPSRLLCSWDFPGKNTGVGCHFLLQGIFPTQEANSGLLHCRQILYQLSYKESPNEGV